MDIKKGCSCCIKVKDGIVGTAKVHRSARTISVVGGERDGIGRGGEILDGGKDDLLVIRVVGVGIGSGCGCKGDGACRSRDGKITSGCTGKVTTIGVDADCVSLNEGGLGREKIARVNVETTMCVDNDIDIEGRISNEDITLILGLECDVSSSTNNVDSCSGRCGVRVDAGLDGLDVDRGTVERRSGTSKERVCKGDINITLCNSIDFSIDGSLGGDNDNIKGR